MSKFSSFDEILLKKRYLNLIIFDEEWALSLNFLFYNFFKNCYKSDD